MPSCGLGAEGNYTTCSPCPAGYFLDEFHDLKCEKCPVGTYSAEPHSAVCARCPWPFSTLDDGSTSCEAVHLDFDNMQLAFTFGALGSVFFFCLVQARSSTFAALSMMVMPTMDVMTDLAFILTSKFFNRTVFAFCIVFYVLSNVAFLYNLYEEGVWYRCFHKSFYTRDKILFLGVAASGHPTWAKTKIDIPILRGTSIILYGPIYLAIWAVLVALQCAAPLLFCVYMLCHFAFIVVWLWVGFFLFQTKVIAITEVDFFWKVVWSGEVPKRDESEAYQMVDLSVLNQSLFLEFLLETLPQIVLQVYNQLKVEGHFTPVGWASTILSGAIMLNGAYRYGYYLFWWGLQFEQVPPSSDLMPNPNSYKPSDPADSEENLSIRPPDLSTPEAMLWHFLFTHRKDLRIPNLLIIQHLRTPEDLLRASDHQLRVLRRNIKGEDNLLQFDALVGLLDRDPPRSYLQACVDCVCLRRRPRRRRPVLNAQDSMMSVGSVDADLD